MWCSYRGDDLFYNDNSDTCADISIHAFNDKKEINNGKIDYSG